MSLQLPTLDDLTPTQRQVAEAVASGAGYKDIAKTLGMHHATVRTHVNTIAGKLPDDDLPAFRRVMIWVICQMNVPARRS
jgi:DNA-binding NarL/FixJ family response regulator